MDAQYIRELTTDTENGNGCVLGDKLNLLTLTDRVNVINQIRDLAQIDIAAIPTTNRLALAQPIDSAILSLSFKGNHDWTWSNIYFEEYHVTGNYSSIGCTDLHYDKPGQQQTNKTYTKQY